MVRFLRGQFKKTFFAGLMVVLVVFGVFGGVNKDVYAEGYFDQLLSTYRERGFWGTIFVPQEEDSYGLTNHVGVYGLGNTADGATPGFGPLLLEQASKFLQWTISDELYNEVFFSEEAREGLSIAWTVVRDFVNMFYLLVLIFLAITTILQINKFTDKKLFVKVLVSAILVNFSMAITVVVIDASNLIMDFFAGAIMQVTEGKDVGNVLMAMSEWQSAWTGGWILMAGVSMMEFIVQIVLAVMLLFLAISLLIRLVAYWVLIVLSPLAFFMLAVPGSNSFNEWKTKLLNYSFYGPLMLMYMWIAVVLMRALHKSFVEHSTDSVMLFFTAYIATLYLLYYGHDKSKEMASKAGETVTKIMKSGGDWAVKAGKGAGAVATLGAAPWAASQAKAQYTGIKAKMMQNDLARQLWKEGRDQQQKERNQIATAAWESGSLNPLNKKRKDAKKFARDSIEFKKMQEKEKAMADAGFDWNNRDAVEDLAKNGSGLAQKVAYMKKAENGWFGIDANGKNGITEALMSVEGNQQLINKIKREAEKSNPYTLMEHMLSLEEDNADRQKYIKDKIKGMMKKDGLSESDINDANKRQNYIATHFGRDTKQAVMSGILSGMKSAVDIGKLASETEEAAQYTANHFSENGRGKNQMTYRGRENVFNNSNAVAQGVFSRSNFLRNTSSNASSDNNILNRDVPLHP